MPRPPLNDDHSAGRIFVPGRTTYRLASLRLCAFGGRLRWRSSAPPATCAQRCCSSLSSGSRLQAPLGGGALSGLAAFRMLCCFLVACGFAGAGRAAVAATGPGPLGRRAAIASAWAMTALVTCTAGVAGFWACTVLAINGGGPEPASWCRVPCGMMTATEEHEWIPSSARAPRN